MSWTLEYSGTRKSLAYWGITSCALQFQSLAADACVFNTAATSGLATPAFAHRGTIILRSGETGSDATSWTGGTTRFRGEIIRRQQSATGNQEGYQYQAAGPWRYLEELIFEQTFKVFAGWSGTPGETPILNDQSTSHVVLNQSVAGALQGTRATLAEVLQWAVDDGAPIQFTSSGFPDMNIPRREQRDILCAEAIRRQLDYMDAVTWFDYTTSPYPTFYCARRSSLTPVSIALDGTAGIAALGLVPRDEQQVPAVVIRFEKAYQDTYGTFQQVVEDTYPASLPASKRGWLTATVVLTPRVTVSQKLVTSAVDATDLDWWKDVKDDLRDADEYANLALVSGSDSRNSSLAYYIVDGAVAAWMTGTVESDNVKAKISFTHKDTVDTGKVTSHKVREQQISAQIQATDLASGTYTVLEDAGEDPSEFTGIAQQIYTDLNVVAWSGSVRIIATEPAFNVGVGNVLNLTGGQTAWTTMNALVQTVSVDIMSGSTELGLGPNPHMDAGQIVDLLRVNRTRTLTHYSATRATAELPGNAQLPKNLPRQNTTEAPKRYESFVAGKTDGTDATKSNRVTIHAADTDADTKPSIRVVQVTSAGAEHAAAGKILVELSRAYGKTIRLREAKVCTPTATKYVLTLSSEPYDTPLIAGETPIGNDAS